MEAHYLASDKGYMNWVAHISLWGENGPEDSNGGVLSPAGLLGVTTPPVKILKGKGVEASLSGVLRWRKVLAGQQREQATARWFVM